MWERFSYYGMRALLVLYLVNALHWPTADAANLYGTYTGLVYLAPLLGGYLADRLIGTRRSLVIGGLIIALGHFTLTFAPNPVATGAASPPFARMIPFYLGLCFVVIGTGFFKPNVSTMVGQLYRPNDARRDAGFSIFYMGINLGSLVGTLVCGALGQSPRFGWHYGFGAAGVGMVLGLIVYLLARERYLPGIGLPPQRTPHVASAAAKPESTEIATSGQDRPLAGLLTGAIGGALGWYGGGWVGFLMGAVIGWALGTAVTSTKGEDRNRVLAIFLVVVFVTVFWAAFEQSGSSLNLFADRNTKLDYLGFRIPSSWLQAVQPGTILIFAPLFAWLWTALARRGREPSTAVKMVWGLAMQGVGFLFMVAGSRIADTGTLVSPLWLVAVYTLNTFGELCLSPVGLSYVTKVAPSRLASLMMGVWFLSNAAASKIAGTVASYTDAMSKTHFFTIFVITSLGAAALLSLLVPVLRRLTRAVAA